MHISHSDRIDYGFIAGIPTGDIAKGEHPHLIIKIKTPIGNPFKVAVNVEDYDKSAVFFAHISDLKASFPDYAAQAENGMHPIKSREASKGIDYIREDFIHPDNFHRIEEHELVSKLTSLLKPYINAENGSRMLVYGSLFANKDGDTVTKGVHDVHMNQGYPHSRPMPYEDGALILYNAETKSYDGLFFHFRKQSFKYQQ